MSDIGQVAAALITRRSPRRPKHAVMNFAPAEFEVSWCCHFEI